MRQGDRIALTLNAAAKSISVSPKILHKEICAGSLRAVNLDGSLRVLRRDLEAWLESKYVEPTVNGGAARREKTWI